MTTGKGRTLAVFGARAGSLGRAVADQAIVADFDVVTFGIDGEDETVDYNDVHSLFSAMGRHNVTEVLVTVGTNLPSGCIDNDYFDSMIESFLVNVEYPLRVMRAAIATQNVHSFAAISSNSAQIPRTNSGPYCASKAALSMALRVSAREWAGESPLIYGYELGLLKDTQMTKASAGTFTGPLSRMKGAEDGLLVRDVAKAIIFNFANPQPGLNGMMIRMDAGEL
jgi:NADP-dependent 3-hydroxy acid dehydrogenase YdfG